MHKNLIANYAGQIWVALISLAFIPIYIQYLGIEAYGLIGFFALLQATLSLLDMSLNPMLGREMARFTGGGYSVQSIANLLRTIEVVAFSIAILFATTIFLGSEWIAEDWLKNESLDSGTVANSCALMGLVAALRFVEAIYRSCVIGLQRQVLYNFVNSILMTTRGVGAVATLAWVSPSIEAFFIWQAVISLLSLLSLATLAYRSLPRPSLAAKFSCEALLNIRSFAGGMFGITLLALLLTQLDKLILSRFLTLSEYGYYTLAAVVAGSLYLLIYPITQAFYPRLCQLIQAGDDINLAKTYHEGSQFVAVIAGAAALTVAVFPNVLVTVWTQDSELSSTVAPLLVLLIIGNLLNGLMMMPYQVQLAHGWTSLAFKVNFCAVLIIVPALLWITPRYGARGAAVVWMALNVGYILAAINLMHKSILRDDKKRWYLNDTLFPLLASALSLTAVRLIAPKTTGFFEGALLLLFAGFISVAMGIFAANSVRGKVMKLIISNLAPMGQRISGTSLSDKYRED